MLAVKWMMVLSNSSALTQAGISYLGYREIEEDQERGCAICIVRVWSVLFVTSAIISIAIFSLVGASPVKVQADDGCPAATTVQ
jgi:hypothetical protein